MRRAGAQGSVSAPAETNNFSADAILLGGERECHARGGQQLPICCGGRVDVDITNIEVHVVEGEGSGLRVCVHIFAWTQQEEESQHDHVGNSPCRVERRVLRQCGDSSNNLNGERLHPMRGGSYFFHADWRRERRKSIRWRSAFNRGSQAPTPRNVCATCRT